jgi:hypothetical protein
VKTFLLLSLFALVPIEGYSITVNYPANDAQSGSPIFIKASASTCKGQPTLSMGYSFDNSPNTTTEPAAFATYALVGNGSHTLHVKCWGNAGSADVTNIPVTIVENHEAPFSTSELAASLNNTSNWFGSHDMGTPGTSSGSTWVTSSPSYSGHARAFSMKFTNGGGERFHKAFTDDVNATHFIYDAQVMLNHSSTLSNVEMDMNQVLSNGLTIIYGFQCNGYSGTWDYSLNSGTATKPSDHWHHSNAKCAYPRLWKQNVWHHVQIAYSRNAAGVVTFHNIVFDGAEQDLVNAVGYSAFALHWGQVLLINFQLDGLGAAGSMDAYVDNVTVYHW